MAQIIAVKPLNDDFLDPSKQNVSVTSVALPIDEDLHKVEPWHARSWKSKPAAQEVQYDDRLALEAVCARLHALPPLVGPQEIEHARQLFYDAARGNKFIIQGGDCAESFLDVRADIINSQVNLLRKQAQILSTALKKPVVTVGRLAGQYAKPRSNPFEVLPNGETVHAFRGHIVNDNNLASRKPDPERLLSGYFHAATTLIAVKQIERTHATTATLPFLTSHEALHLPYESSLTHARYNTSAAFIWLGERTRQINGAHMEYARGLRNPIGVKIGPTSTPEQILDILNFLSPDSQQGRGRNVVLITRLGAGKASEVLSPIIQAVRESTHLPVWMCDPCHGNTTTVHTDGKGFKTRMLGDMLAELKETYAVLRTFGSRLGGIHLEQTGQDVTECLDGVRVREASDLTRAYTSLCDPRLSGQQALDLIREFVKFVEGYQG